MRALRAPKLQGSFQDNTAGIILKFGQISTHPCVIRSGAYAYSFGCGISAVGFSEDLALTQSSLLDHAQSYVSVHEPGYTHHPFLD